MKKSTSIGDGGSVRTMSTKLNTAPGQGCVDMAKSMAGKENPGGTKPMKPMQSMVTCNAGSKS